MPESSHPLQHLWAPLAACKAQLQISLCECGCWDLLLLAKEPVARVLEATEGKA